METMRMGGGARVGGCRAGPIRRSCDGPGKESRVYSFFFSSRRRHTRFDCDWSSDVCSSDLHLVRAYYHTYGLPTLIVNCSNNYGPYQFPEKLIPLMILNAITHKPLPVYGEGGNVRDWLYVQDHCTAIRQVLEHGRIGESYNVGGYNQKTNLEVVNAICALLDEARPNLKSPHSMLISFVKDRPGHDRRYAMDATKIAIQLEWTPSESFDSGLRKTVASYLDNPDWVAHVTSGAYRQWIEQNYAKRGEA